MNNQETILKALNLAIKYHKGAVDKGGNDYVLHPITVALLVDGESEKVVALLHDIVEDTPMTLPQLLEEGFTKEIVDAVDSVTRRNGEERQDYLIRVKSNEIACKVKIADLIHNSDLSRIQCPKQKDIERVKEYKKEIEYLRN